MTSSANRSLVLASSSPRRIDLLRDAGFDFTIDPADIDESGVPAGLSPRELAEHLARAKAAVVAARHPQSVVIGADTVVAVGSRLFGKADSPDDARAMLGAMADTDQEVITGVALFVPSAHDSPWVESHVTRVRMRAMSDAELDAYIASDDWRGKAGAYGIQDQGDDPFVTIVEGSFANVVGLPIDETVRLLERAGVRPPTEHRR